MKTRFLRPSGMISTDVNAVVVVVCINNRLTPMGPL